MNFEDIKGKTFCSVDRWKDSLIYYGDAIRFKVDHTESYVMYHAADCCESVTIESVSGDLSDLVGTPICLAEEVVSSAGEGLAGSIYGELQEQSNDERDESCTWTFYKISTAKGHVTIRWIGVSNGYYSESVYFVKEKTNS